MIGIDTNVLVRYLVRDDLEQAQAATKIIEDAIEVDQIIYINCIVLCEMVWVLDSAYDCEKSAIVSLLKKILSAKQFEIEKKSLIWQATDDYSATKADFADCLIGRLNSTIGCNVTYTFDKSLKNIKQFTTI